MKIKNIICLFALLALQSVFANEEATKTYQARLYQTVVDTAFFNSPDTTSEDIFNNAVKDKKLQTLAILNANDQVTVATVSSKQIRYNESLVGDATTADVGMVVEITINSEGEGVQITMNPRITSRLPDVELKLKDGVLLQPVFGVVEARTSFFAKLNKPIIYIARPLSDAYDGSGAYIEKQEVFFIVVSEL